MSADGARVAWRALALGALLVSCASPVDFAREQRPDTRCARVAEERCREQLGAADQQACIKRETATCELGEP